MIVQVIALDQNIMKTQQLVTPIIFFLISQFDISNGDQGTACQKYKDDPCSDIICANENWISTSFDVHDKLNISKRGMESIPCLFSNLNACLLY